ATLALRCMDGVFLSPDEDEFVGRIAEELEQFMLQGQHRRVLLFPPLSSRLRYLIHRTVDNVDLLSSFSVGEGWRRRTVICHSAVRLPGSETSDQKPSSNPTRPQRAPQAWGPGRQAGAGRGGTRIKRPPWKKPDKALYVPKAMRKRAEWGERESPVAAGTESENSNDFSGQESQEKDCSDSLSSVHNKNPTEAEEQDQSCDNAVVPEGSESLCRQRAEDQTSRDAGAAESGLRGPKCGPGGLPFEVKPCLIYGFFCYCSQIVGYLTVKDISIEKISFDYSSYGDAQLSEGDFGHVTEIYDFPPSLKTENLLEVFSDFHESGFKIQWVDDTHALGIFSSLSWLPSQALGRRYPCLKIRPLIHATKQSKTKALQRPKLLHLAKERPQTDTAVAKRLVTRALGLKHKQQDVSGAELLLPESLDQEE
ncbi:R3H and coiled-coil domain-containing protein 1, partial [Opisthocomus hoazin]